MFETLFGPNVPFAARLAIAVVIVVGLIGVMAWVIRRFGARRFPATTARGRQPHLDVIEAANVDGKRRLVLIRRDNAEHLMMIGGPNDLVIEVNVVRAGTPREAQASRPPTLGEALPRSVPLGEGSTRPPQPHPARPEHAPRPPNR
jgi:flagellar protein FliO/FliZ